MEDSKKKNSLSVPRAVSRNFQVRDFSEEKKQTPPVEQPPVADSQIGRRELLRTLLPATGQALTGFLRNLKTETALSAEDKKSQD